jgi:hypothetical protein
VFVRIMALRIVRSWRTSQLAADHAITIDLIASERN